MNKSLLLLVSVLVLASCGNSPKSGKKPVITIVTGAGATFPLPYYNLAFKTYKDSTGTAVTYGGIGSGGGIRSLKDEIVDFAGSDAFLSEKEISEIPSPVIHIPTCMGAVVLAYHLPGIKDLRLSGEIIAGIYLGEILRWNDPKIQSINKEAALPDSPIHAVYRSDGSGTTYVFSDYLSKVSPDWTSRVGIGKALKWPVGLAAKGNPGVAGIISQTEGAIGYIGSEYAFALRIPTALLQNKAGNFIAPVSKSISAAAATKLPADTRTMITDSPAPDAYPISCFTWLLLYKEQNYNNRSEEQAKETVKLLEWMLSEKAQTLATKAHYSPLPPSVKTNAQLLLKSVTFDEQPLLP